MNSPFPIECLRKWAGAWLGDSEWSHDPLDPTLSLGVVWGLARVTTAVVAQAFSQGQVVDKGLMPSRLGPGS